MENKEIREMLEKQMELLSKHSAEFKACNDKSLVEASLAMCELANTIHRITSSGI